MTIVDANVVAAWFIDQAVSTSARRILADPTPRAAPDIIVAEIGSALWKTVRAGVMTETTARAAYTAALKRIDRLESTTPIADRALSIAIAFNHPIYDCFYLALAERDRAPLATADRRLAKLAEELGIEVDLISA